MRIRLTNSIYLFGKGDQLLSKQSNKKNVVGVVLSCRFKDIRQERITRGSLLFSQQMLVSYRYSYPQLITTKPFLCCIVPFALTRMDGARTKKEIPPTCGRYSKWKNLTIFSFPNLKSKSLWKKRCAKVCLSFWYKKYLRKKYCRFNSLL